jgi:Zn ribbon nucleic-acid-binding protein
MSQTQPATPLCPMCHKTMKPMLVKETAVRKLRCMDCGQPDPMASTDTQGWFNGELGSKN